MFNKLKEECGIFGIYAKNSEENLAYNTNYTFTLYLWIDGTIGANPMDMTNQTYQFSLVCDITGEGTNKVQDKSPENAAEYITNLYTNAQKSTATVNNITYNLAPSVNLMNDRHASMSTDINGGDIRYYGANPNNYVWLGDYYVENETETKKLWRVIGVFNGRVKLIQDVPIGDYPWDISANTVNSGYGINQWGESGNYEGSDLMRLLNPGFEGTTYNNSLYWNKTSGNAYTWDWDINTSTTVSADFANTGLSSTERNMIDTVTWYNGAYDNYSYVDAHYNAERGNMGKICSGGNWCNDNVTRTSTWNGKVGLIYPSDYGYASNLQQCNHTLGEYYESGCFDTNWLKQNYWYWTMSSRALSGNASFVFFVNGDGGLNDVDARNDYAVRPAVYLKRGVTIDTEGKDGSESNPYVLNY